LALLFFLLLVFFVATFVTLEGASKELGPDIIAPVVKLIARLMIMAKKKGLINR
jgi:hypothetical protein